MKDKPQHRNQEHGADPPVTPGGREEMIDVATQVHARQLLDRAGSIDAAKYAIDMAKNKQPDNPGSVLHEFARNWGFASYREMFAASIPTLNRAGQTYLLTPLRDQRWLAWQQSSWADAQAFGTQEAAKRHLDAT